jgi:hypothetical protein
MNSPKLWETIKALYYRQGRIEGKEKVLDKTVCYKSHLQRVAVVIYFY